MSAEQRLTRAKWRGSTHAGRSGTDGLLPRYTHLQAPWEADSFLELKAYLASCLEPRETLGGICSGFMPPTPLKYHIYLILGLIFLFLHCGWDSLTLNKDQRGRRSFLLF